MKKPPKISFQLGRLLLEQADNIEGEISAAELADAIDLSRQRIYALLDGHKVGGLQLKVLGRLCHYLRGRGVKAELPGRLFMFQTVREVISRSTEVNTYVPLYRAGREAEADCRRDPISSWISPRDATVHDLLSHWSPMEKAGSKVNLEFVDHDSRPGEPATESSSVDLWNKINESKLCTNIIIGSFLVNNLAEQMLADFCGVKPWGSPSDEVPFIMSVNKGHKDYIHGIGWRDSEQQGIKYRELESGEWIEQAFFPNRVEGGVIMTRYDTKRGTLDIALMGITGRATLELANYLAREDANAFWPTTSSLQDDKSQYVGMWVCNIQYDPEDNEKVNVTPTRVM